MVLFHANGISCPIILFQGMDDPVVPPDQANVLIAEMNEKKLPVAYRFFEGESHGFRKAETIVTALEEELAFYGVFLGFTPAGSSKMPRIHNMPDNTG